MTAPAMVAESDHAREAPAEGRRRALDAGEPFVVIAGSGLILLFALWLPYFHGPAGAVSATAVVGPASERRRFGVFAALAALGAGLEVAVERSGRDLAATVWTAARR